VKAGYQLADHIRTIRARAPRSPHVIVAHSHGGNVALLAHKHLPEEWHASGIATLGTPFLYANHFYYDLASATEALLREDIKISPFWGTIGWLIAGILAAIVTIILDKALGQWTEWSLLISAGIGWAVFSVAIDPVIRFLTSLSYWVGPQRTALKLGQALALKPMPRTHVLSVIYPGDEAGLVLGSLEKATGAPSRAIRMLAQFGGLVALPAIVIFAAIAFLSEPISWALGLEDGRLDVLVPYVAKSIVLAGLVTWVVLVASRQILALLRGHPLGFGWERPSIHAHIDIGTSARPLLPGAKSEVHVEAPFTVDEDAARGLRHSLLYEDKRILKSLASWIAQLN
jgi:hypothetical protein